MRRSRWLLLAAVPTVLALGAAAFVFLEAQHSLDQAGKTVALRGQIAFQVRTLGRMENPGFETLASPSRFVSGAIFHGELFLSGPSGLFVYGADNSLEKSYRVGIDLPAAPLGQMVVGRLRGSSEQALLIATAGAGVLSFSESGGVPGSGSIRQIYASDADARDVTALLPLASGELLIGTRRRGLLQYDGKTLVSFHTQFENLAITALAADETGFWAGTRDHGVRHWHAGQIDSFDANGGSTAEGLPDDEVDAIAVRGNNVFVGTPMGVEQFDGGRPTRLLAKGVFAHSLFADDKEVLVASMDQGIRRVSLESTRRSGITGNDWDGGDAGSGGVVEEFFEGSGEIGGGSDAKVLYAVTQDGVRQRFSEGSWSSLKRTLATSPTTLTDGLTDGNVSSLAFGLDGRLWVGYFDRGLDILPANHDHNGSAPEHREDDHLFCINRIVTDPQRHTMAVATANGLVLFDAQGRPRQVLTRRDGLIADHVTDVAFAGGAMVVATPAGLTFVQAGGTESLYAFQGLVNNHVYALGVAKDSAEILAGTLGGISMLRNESVSRNLTVGNSGLKHNWITAIVPIGSGSERAWLVGTYGAGVMQMDRDGAFAQMDGMSRDVVINPNAMLVTDTHVFAGSLGRGLWVCNRATGRWKQITSGLPSENVTAIAEQDGEVYVGTENGLVHIQERLLG